MLAGADIVISLAVGVEQEVVPVPLTVSVYVLEYASVIVTVAVLLPAAEGANFTVTLVAETAVTVKSLAFVPETLEVTVEVAP